MKPQSIIYYVIVLCMLQMLNSCGEDDLKSATKLNGKINLSSDTTRDVNITYSDSAKVKAQFFAPMLVKVVPMTGASYQEMSKGVKINFLNPEATIKGSITSDYAIMKDVEKTATFQRNVVVINEKLTYNTEELVWDQTKKKFFSPKGVITKPDGTVLTAVNFSATEDFNTITWDNGTGQVYVPDNYGQ
ncbi:hypothetical protein ACXZ1K_04955 [Pedobacter sp. PWIIR3]